MKRVVKREGIEPSTSLAKTCIAVLAQVHGFIEVGPLSQPDLDHTIRLGALPLSYRLALFSKEQFSSMKLTSPQFRYQA